MVDHSKIGRGAQRKGKKGEVEFCKWLKDHLGIDTERNYNQADGTSADIIISDFIFEIKRQEQLDFGSWWHQVSIAAKRNKVQGLIPVVAFRQNHKKWEFLIPAKLVPGLELGYLRATERVFLQLIRGTI